MAEKYSYVLAWKRVVDVIPLVIDFTSQLLPGETIQLNTLTVSVFVFAGYDNNPSAIINGSAILDSNNPNGIIQSIQQGLPGVTYGLVLWITTSTSRLISLNAKISVLLDGLPATPVYIPFYYTSWPYPIEYTESIQTSVSPLSGHLLLNPVWAEGLTTSIYPHDSSLILGAISYPNWVPDEIETSITPQTFYLTQANISYTNWPSEGITNSILPTSGTLTKGAIYYNNYVPEGIETAITPLSGTLQ